MPSQRDRRMPDFVNKGRQWGWGKEGFEDEVEWGM